MVNIFDDKDVGDDNDDDDDDGDDDVGDDDDEDDSRMRDESRIRPGYQRLSSSQTTSCNLLCQIIIVVIMNINGTIIVMVSIIMVIMHYVMSCNM